MRKFMTSTLGAILVLVGIAGAANAANFTDTSLGISIDVDNTLKKQPLMRDIQSFVADDMTGSLVIKPVFDLTLIDFLDELSQGGYRDSRHDLILRIFGEPVEADIKAGRGLLIPVRGQIRGQQIRGVIGAYSAHDGHGFLVIGTTKPEDWPAWEQRMKTMFASVSFVEVDHKAMVKKWQNRLKGKKLEYKQAKVSTNAPAGAMPGAIPGAAPPGPMPGTLPGAIPGAVPPGPMPGTMPGAMPGVAPPGMFYGGERQQDYHLCSNGTMLRESASVGEVTGQNVTLYGRGMNRDRGTWRVTVSRNEPFLVVRDGAEQGLSLEVDGDTFLLDGKPYSITASDKCK
jgi:hypothetical protein